MTNPFTTNRKIFASYTLIWLFIFIASIILIFFTQDIKINSAVIDSAIFTFIYFILGIGVWYTVRFNSLETYKTPKLILNHFVASILTSTIWITTGSLISLNILSDDPNYVLFINSSYIWRFLIGILFYIVLISIDYLIIYYNNFQEKVLKESELKSLVKEAELNALKYQINPHFIFNSLNSISSLTISNPQLAQEMTIKLSTFLRNTLSRNDSQKSKLIDEINAAKLYLEIEKIRFDDKFELIEEIDLECKNFEVPSMILQPLFENSIKHGVYESLEKVTIKLSCHKENNFIKISVENDFDNKSISKKGAGIGLKNIYNRMKLIYGQENLVEVIKEKSKFIVNIYIPNN
ncbi:MAG: histidine kinase [Melioribacteraceae bacterium]|nr:histidine kinase [Melioribacteraceae bacterium]